MPRPLAPRALLGAALALRFGAVSLGARWYGAMYRFVMEQP